MLEDVTIGGVDLRKGERVALLGQAARPGTLERFLKLPHTEVAGRKLLKSLLGSG